MPHILPRWTESKDPTFFQENSFWSPLHPNVTPPRLIFLARLRRQPLPCCNPQEISILSARHVSTKMLGPKANGRHYGGTYDVTGGILGRCKASTLTVGPGSSGKSKTSKTEVCCFCWVRSMWPEATSLARLQTFVTGPPLPGQTLVFGGCYS